MIPDAPVRNETEKADQTHAVWSVAERLLGVACAAVLLTMMLLTGVDVVARYLFDSPLRGAFELTEMLLAILVFLSLPLATRAGAHVEVELWEPASRFGKLFVRALATVCGLLVFGGLAQQLALHGLRLAENGAVTNALRIPLAYSAYLASACCAVTAVVLAANFVRRGGTND